MSRNNAAGHGFYHPERYRRKTGRFDSGQEATMDSTTLLIILVIILLLGGGGFYGRGRWY
jgi:hypothetical protein